MKIIKKINDCFVALALTTFVCIGPAAMPAFAAALEDPDQTEEPLVSTQDPAEDATATEADGEQAASEGAPVVEQPKAIDVDELANDEVAAQDEATPAEEAAVPMALAAEAEAPNSFTVSTADELKDAFQKIDSNATGTYTVNLAADVTMDESLNVNSGRTVDFVGNGHTLTLGDSATLGTNGGTLNLNGDLTITAAGAHDSALVTIVGGTLNMNDGVTITGNSSNGDGGGVCLSDKATFNMNGGTIEHCQAHQGGGVYMDRNTTFNMNGGTIRNNLATNVGGGVYVNTRATFTMSGSASVVENSADAAGGVMNYGLVTLTTVYNNTTRNGAADIFNDGRMKLSPTNPDWVLSSTGTNVTGWYIDNYSSTDESGQQSGGNHRWNPALDDNVEYTPTAGETREVLYLIAGAPLPEEPRINVIWENLDGTILYTMSDVKESEVPAADEYNELSGNADPTEPDAGNIRYVFDNWEEYEDSQGDVIYKAEYHALPDDAPVMPDEQTDIDIPDAPDDDPTTTPDDGSNGDATENENKVDVQNDESDDNGDGDDADSSTAPKMNDTGMALSLAATGGIVAGLAGIAYIRHRRNEEDM